MKIKLHKLAVFVEGMTEIQFLDRFISEIGEKNRVVIEHRRISGGGKSPRTMRTINAVNIESDTRFYILLFDCGGEHQVATRIREEHQNLTRSGFNKIIGMRDVFPNFTHEYIPKLEAGLRKYIKTSLIPVEFILSVMEVEAWFLAEFNHFQKIDPAISTTKIKNALGFDPEFEDMSLRQTPCNDLNAAYGIGGKTYQKGQTTTIDALDYPYLYVELSNKIPYLKRLGNSLDEFFSQP